MLYINNNKCEDRFDVAQALIDVMGVNEFMDELVHALSAEQMNELAEYICTNNDINCEVTNANLDRIGEAIYQALGCTVEAAQGMREWVFDAIDENDTVAIERLKPELNEFSQWYADLDELNAAGYAIKDGTVYEIDPVENCEYMAECDYFMDSSFGVLLIFH